MSPTHQLEEGYWIRDYHLVVNYHSNELSSIQHFEEGYWAKEIQTHTY